VKFYVRSSILLKNRKCSPLGVNEGVNIPPRRLISPLGARDEVKNGPQPFVVLFQCPKSFCTIRCPSPTEIPAEDQSAK
jgi:hypothetical protein